MIIFVVDGLRGSYTATLLLVFGFDVDGLNTREKI